MRAFDARFAAEQRHGGIASGQVDLEHHAAHHLALERALADRRGQPAAVGHRQPDAPGVGPERLHVGAQQFQPRQRQGDLVHPGRKARRLALAQMRRRVAPVVHLVPAADLDRAELRVLERPPVDMGLSAALLVAPLQQLQVVGHRVLAVPVDPLVVGDAGLPVGRPDLDHPEQCAQVLVDPVLRAGDHFLRVVAELMPDAGRRVAGVLGAERAEAFEGPQVLGHHVVVAHRAHRPQDHTAVGVVADGGADVRVLQDEVDHRLDLGLARRIVAGAELLEFLPPEGREIAVQVQPLGVRVQPHREAVVVLQRALGHQAVVVAAEFTRLARHHQARLGGVLLVAAVRVGDAHRQDAAVAVDILRRQAVDRLLIERIAPRARADVARPVAQRELGAVGVQARTQVDSARVEQVGDLWVAAVARHQVMQVIQHRGAGGQLGGVDVAVGPERRLVGVRPGRAVGDAHRPDLAPLETAADRFEADEIRISGGVFPQQRGERGVLVEDVEARRGRGGT